MPERWENELRKLRRVERPSSLEDRIAEGPRHEAGRPTRERVAAAVVAFAVCATVGVVGYRAVMDDDGAGGSDVATGIPSGDEALVLELTSDDAQPTATIWYANEGQDGVLEGYNWCPDGTTGQEQCTSAIADFAFYPPPNEFLVLPPGTPIEVTGDGSIHSLGFEEVCDPMPCGTAVSFGDELVPSEDGRYAIKVQATWPQGDATVWFGIQVLSSEAAAPDVLTVDCSFGLVRTDTSVVRTTPDGVDVSFIGGEGSRAFEILSSDGEISGIGDENARPYRVHPGSWAIGCGRDVDIANAAPFELVDPDDHYASWDLACGDVEPTEFVSGVPRSVPHEDASAQIVGGLAEGDRIRDAGYDAEMYKLGPTYVVERDGESVARLVLGAPADVWTGTLAVCEGSGIGFANATPGPSSTHPGGATGPSGVIGSGATGATGSSGPTVATGSSGAVGTPLADELVVRCEGLGPALEHDQVVSQNDGVHVEATNIADAEVVVIEDADGKIVAGSFAEVTQRFVVQLEPGVYWFGCRVNDEDGELDGSHLDRPDAYARFEVVAAA